MIALASLVEAWDRDYDAMLPAGTDKDLTQPYLRILQSLYELAPIRFHGYRNDDIPEFMTRLRVWLGQFPESQQPAAFYLASRVVFVGSKQFESLQRNLFDQQIRRILLESSIIRHGLDPFDYKSADVHFREEMNATLFVPNSDSSALNSFVHVNNVAFANRERRRLVGQDIRFWTYASTRAKDTSDAGIRATAAQFENDVINTDKRIAPKRRLIVIEDFSGTGDDLLTTLNAIDRSSLRVAHIVIAPVVATQTATRHLQRRCTELSASGRRLYELRTALEIPDRFSCVDQVSSYLSAGSPVPDIAAKIREMSASLWTRFDPLKRSHMYGYGRLGLALVLFSNVPDNSLPMLWWNNPENWTPLFRRVSRYV